MSGASLITYRINGGYFTSPRWGKKCRKGYMAGRKMGEYSPEKIKNMTLDELNEAIRKDLYVNAFDEQKIRMVPFHGNDIAENLEIALYLCPLCGGVGTLKSQRDQFFCSCGLRLRYTPFGLFESNGNGAPPFQSVLDWSRWQGTKIAEQSEETLRRSPDKPIFFDDAQSLWKINRANCSELQGKGKLFLFTDRLELKQEDGRLLSFPLDKIDDMAIFRSMVLMFTTSDQETFEITSDKIRSPIKYIEVYKYLKSKRTASW
jgi:hypothetical protein